MFVEERIHIAVSPATIDHIWREVEVWPLWDPVTKKAHLNGPFEVSSSGRVTPQKGIGVAMIITECAHGHSFILSLRPHSFFPHAF